MVVYVGICLHSHILISIHLAQHYHLVIRRLSLAALAAPVICRYPFPREVTTMDLPFIQHRVCLIDQKSYRIPGRQFFNYLVLCCYIDSP